MLRNKLDMLTAFQLANNYEADLIKDGIFYLSPLGLSYEDNCDLIAKYLGKRFLKKSGGFNLREYRHDYPIYSDYDCTGECFEMSVNFKRFKNHITIRYTRFYDL